MKTFYAYYFQGQTEMVMEIDALHKNMVSGIFKKIKGFYPHAVKTSQF